MERDVSDAVVRVPFNGCRGWRGSSRRSVTKPLSGWVAVLGSLHSRYLLTPSRYGATGGVVDALRRRSGRIPLLWVLSSIFSGGQDDDHNCVDDDNDVGDAGNHHAQLDHHDHHESSPPPLRSLLQILARRTHSERPGLRFQRAELAPPLHPDRTNDAN